MCTMVKRTADRHMVHVGDIRDIFWVYSVKTDLRLRRVSCHVDQVVMCMDITFLVSHNNQVVTQYIPRIYYTPTFKHYWFPVVTIVSIVTTPSQGMTPDVAVNPA